MKKLTSVVALAALAMLMTGCDRTKSHAEKAIRDSLNDPDSAKFFDYYFNEKTERGCYVVNAKNKMGGYTGKKVVIFVKEKDQIAPADTSELGFDLCKKAADDTKSSG